ncbi:P-loop containing nucleoside triphosphate hydrolase protein, partial [Rhodocollybia butyracea]
GSIKLPASTGFVKGRAAPLKISHAIGSSNAILTGSIISRGRDGPTTADSRKADIVLDILKGKMSLFTENPWIINLWDPPHGVMSWPARSTPHYFKSESVTVPETGPKRPLNHSQTLAIEKMLSPKDEDRIILIRGPPGSGKTSVISRFVEIAYSRDCPGIWLIAQSNVAVKNIAEKLASIGFMNWRLLISVDFHLDWHEHLYGHDIKDNIIRSDDFYTMLPTRIAGCKVILCTLSMLSSQWIRKKFLPSIPIHTLIVDEASQIEIGDYLPVFTLAVTKLEKMCLIGDDKQLPPHGQEDIEELQSVFEINHLHAYVHLLDTQYRMPPQMGDFISEQVYESLLKSNALHPITNSTIACQFLDIPGTEKMQNNSFIVSFCLQLFSLDLWSWPIRIMKKHQQS